MIIPVTEYLEAEKYKGTSRKILREYLITSGYNESDVNETLEEVFRDPTSEELDQSSFAKKINLFAAILIILIIICGFVIPLNMYVYPLILVWGSTLFFGGIWQIFLGVEAGLVPGQSFGPKLGSNKKRDQISIRGSGILYSIIGFSVLLIAILLKILPLK